MIPYVLSPQFRRDIREIQATLNRLFSQESQMAISEQQFDAVLTPYLAAVTAYVTAAQAYFVAAQAALAAVPGVDLTAEANEVSAAQGALATAAAAVPADPSVPVPSVTPIAPPPATP